MPGIGASIPLGSPPDEIQRLQTSGYLTEVSYASPHGEFELNLDHGNEFRMGCEVWYRTRIFENGRDISERHEQLLTYVERNHPYCTTGLHPWNRTGDKLAIPTVSVQGVGFVMYDVARSLVRYTWREPVWHGSAWSPSRDELFLMITNNYVVVEGNGEVRGRVIVEGPAKTHVCGWTPSGDSFFYLDQSDAKDAPLLRFFDSETLQPVEQASLAPAVLVPYDQNISSSINRDTYSLPMTSGAVGVGSLLDEWSPSSMADPDACRLLLATTRPSHSSPAHFEEQWIAVEITD